VGLALKSVRVPVDLVIADPPYDATADLAEAIDDIARPGVLSATSVVVIEQAWTSEPAPRVGELPLASTRRHGRTRITLYASGQSEPLLS
jgi:16S rRNA G966 N2-methylase RsmD